MIFIFQLQLYDVFDSDPTILESDELHHFKYVAHEHFEGGVPLNQILSDKAMSEQRARDIFSQICYGLQHCHARKVAHWWAKYFYIILHGLIRIYIIYDYKGF